MAAPSSRTAGSSTWPHCIRKGLIRPGSYVAGTMQWTLTRTGEERANISYVANLVDPADAWVRLIYTSTTRATGAKVDNDYRVRLETTRPNFGGLRWWFLCPITGRLRLLGRLVSDSNCIATAILPRASPIAVAPSLSPLPSNSSSMSL